MNLRLLLTTGALVAVCGGLAHAQTNSGIGIHFGGYDFYGPQSDNYLLSDVSRYSYNTGTERYDTSTVKRIAWRPLVKVSWWRELNRNFTISAMASFASLDYPTSDKDTIFTRRTRYNNSGERNEKLLAEVDLRFNYNILSRQEHTLAPYVFAGISGSYHDIFFGADIPLGVGVNVALTKNRNLSLNLESAYKVAATGNNVNHLQHSAGVIFWFRPGYKPPATETGPNLSLLPPPDADNDGIEDSVDQCPTIPGTAQFNGCPDSDGDGISDKDDQCPLVAGVAQFNGCPDTDGDGIPDNKDKCPYQAGTAEREGCPVPDKDNDGFTDDVDRCPDVYSKTNQGCPEIRREVIMQVEKAAKAIFFETGKATLKPISNKSLDAVVAILKADPSLYADIEGHTDNVQPKTYTNMDLSQRRAETVRDYFSSHGISADRMTATGFGETQPIADNATAAGKAQNRRTVIKLRNYKK